MRTPHFTFSNPEVWF